MVEAVESCKRNYERLLRKLSKDQNYALTNLLTLKAVILEIEANAEEDGEPVFQGQKLKYYLREKQYIKDHSAHILEQIISCIEERYCKVCSDDFYERYDSKYDTPDEGDGVLFDVCCMLNSKVWTNMQGSNDDTDEQLLHKQLESLSNIYDRFQPILLKCLPSICLDELHNGYVNVGRYANRYFNCVEIDPLDMWSTIRKITVDKEWKGILLLIERCLCAPLSNATL